MQFLKTLLWVVLAVALVLFASANWKNVDIAIWGGLIVGVNLPLLVAFSFLLGLLPATLICGARNWSLRRRLETQQGPVAVGNAPPVARNAPAPPETVARTNS